MAKVSKAQKRATEKYQAKNKEQQRVYRYRSYARKFVRDIANENDLEELQEMISKRMEEIRKASSQRQSSEKLQSSYHAIMIVSQKWGRVKIQSNTSERV